jgi:hypothetical protein
MVSLSEPVFDGGNGDAQDGHGDEPDQWRVLDQRSTARWQFAQRHVGLNFALTVSGQLNGSEMR